MGTATKLFFYFGGVAIILGILAKGVKPAVKRAIKWAISKDHPEVRAFCLEHREWIEAQFDAADQAAKEALDEEASAPASPAETPKTA